MADASLVVGMQADVWLQGIRQHGGQAIFRQTHDSQHRFFF
jgi:hypothetical protein